MLVFGRLSRRITSALSNVASAMPTAFELETVKVQVHGVPAVVVPLTLFVLVTVRSGAATVTLLLQVLFPSLVSTTLLPGSTAHTLPAPVRGFAYVPAAEAVAAKPTSKLPPGAMVTGPPLAVQVRSLL